MADLIDQLRSTTRFSVQYERDAREVFADAKKGETCWEEHSNCSAFDVALATLERIRKDPPPRFKGTASKQARWRIVAETHALVYSDAPHIAPATFKRGPCAPGQHRYDRSGQCERCPTKLPPGPKKRKLREPGFTT